MLRIGLTGGIASGKSAVADMFAALGVPIVDTDLIARDVVVPGSPGLEALRNSFGDSVLTTAGELDRRKLRALVFADEAARNRLEAILHPLIRAETLRRLAAVEAPYAVIVVPLLLETDFAALVDRVLVIDCPRDAQIARLIARDRLTRDSAEAMLGAQTTRERRLAAADDIVDNGGSLDSTRIRVAALHRQYSSLARDCPSPRGRAE